jgi:acyl-CoA thioester hydrolase
LITILQLFWDVPATRGGRSVPEAFEKVFEVRWGDVDLNGHLRNTSYVEYANHARVAFFQEAGFPVSRMVRAGIGPILLSEQIEYRNETFLGEYVTVRWQIVAMSSDGSRYRIFHRLLHPDGRTAATITALGAWIDIRLRKLVAPPPEVRSLLDMVCSSDCDAIVVGSGGDVSMGPASQATT